VFDRVIGVRSESNSFLTLRYCVNGTILNWAMQVNLELGPYQAAPSPRLLLTPSVYPFCTPAVETRVLCFAARVPSVDLQHHTSWTQFACTRANIILGATAHALPRAGVA
jgi:hypothetical protein